MSARAIFQLRGDPAADWASVNPVLAAKEPGLETDTKRVKYGDGITPWNGLPYGAAAAPSASEVANTPAGNISATDLQAAINELDSEKLAASALDIDPTLAANSDARVATQKAVKTFIAAAIAAAVTGLFEFKGSTNCSANPNYPAASSGDAYVVSAAGKIGGAAGLAVDIGDVYVASADNAGGTQASVGASWFILEHNLAGALLAANNLSDLASAPAARINLGLIIGTHVQAWSAVLDLWAAITPGTNVGAFLASPTSANLLAALTDETGTGALVFGTAPTLATPVLNGLPTGTGVAAVATASTLVSRDANGNTAANNFVEGYATTATAAGTTTLAIGAAYTQIFTGSATQTAKLPTTSVLQGQQYLIINQSSGAVTVQSSGANTIVILAAGTSAIFTAAIATPTTAANWGYQYAGLVVASGKVGTLSNTLTFTGTDGSSIAFGGGGTVLYSGGAGGTPSSLTLTNATGLPIAGLTGLGSGIATWLATPSSANLAAAITDETGTTKLVFSDAPTFTTGMTLSGAAAMLDLVESGTAAHGINLKTGGTTESFFYQYPVSGETRLSSGRAPAWGGTLSIYTDTALRLTIGATGHITPGADNTQNLGSAGLRFKELFAGTGTINTSDEREKMLIGPIPDEWLDAWEEVRWVRFKMRAAVAEKGQAARWHLGAVAQQIRDAFEARGLDALSMGLLCYDKWDRQKALRAKHDRRGNLVRDARPAIEAGDRWGLRYDECQAIEVAWQRRKSARQDQEIERLARANAALEYRLAKLERAATKAVGKRR